MHYMRKAGERGHANFGWLDSHHSFSFGNYYDPEHMGVSALRVINDDVIAPQSGFDMHGHRDMEIITYVTKGAVTHRDSMGNGFDVPAGEVQVMSAGTGVMHSEHNLSETDALHLLQIWIMPNVMGSTPRYDQKRIEVTGSLTPLVTVDGREGSLVMQQDASLYRVQLQPGGSQALPAERTGYLHVVNGTVEVSSEEGSQQLASGDGLGFSAPVRISTDSSLHALYFDLP